MGGGTYEEMGSGKRCVGVGGGECWRQKVCGDEDGSVTHSLHTDGHFTDPETGRGSLLVLELI